MLCRFRSNRYSCTKVHSVPFSLSFAPIEKSASHYKIYLTKFLHYEVFKVQVRRGVEHLTSYHFLHSLSRCFFNFFKRKNLKAAEAFLTAYLYYHPCLLLSSTFFEVFANFDKNQSKLPKILLLYFKTAGKCRPLKSFLRIIDKTYFVHSLVPYLHCFNWLDAISLLFLSYTIIFAL